ncbi:DUF222 domain-containing protein [Pseudarthrobacter sp. J75]|uniref:HNH endonuclease signature motif containing protein n=1 Tax=unclassified Pseudarthrobacter TaxID=2647000 RepID=UPI002E804A39|nr:MULTISPECIES: DUF222 domain-containing protein [unclassified Pseudarthrobacter]MEE2521609.1 DUF222 domain-containing protein [Pseudarthrobacter sp. J47]MEE2527686.1 DUF222 domain-containing protein [Pseudarthrobacter sp. J75]
MDARAVAEAVEAVAASVAALRDLVGSPASDSNTTLACGAPSDPLPDASGGSAAGPVLTADDPSDPPRDEFDACLGGLAEVARLEARVAALKVRLTAACVAAQMARLAPDASDCERGVAEMSTVAEIACALTVSEGAAGGLVELSNRITTALPLTLQALGEGSLSWQHARILADETNTMNPATATAFEARFLDPTHPDAGRGCPPGEMTPSRFRARARYWREHHYLNTIEQRHTKCHGDRRLEYRPDKDGMAWLNAYLPAHDAAAIWNRATATARGLQHPDEPRTLTQLRADIAATWLLTTGLTEHERRSGESGGDNGRSGGDPTRGVSVVSETGGPEAGGNPGGSAAGGATGRGAAGGRGFDRVPSPRAQVLVTVPVFTLMGLGDEPAVLDGYGPIPPSMARRLVANGADSFHRVLTDPRDGTPLEIGRTSYRIPKNMRRFLMLRDEHCQFPGCTNHSLDNEADHLTAWEHGGPTAITNLTQLCRKHHHLKHNTTWTPTQATTNQPPGWTSPTGRTYPPQPHHQQPTTWPPGTLPPAASAAHAAARDDNPTQRRSLPTTRNLQHHRSQSQSLARSQRRSLPTARPPRHRFSSRNRPRTCSKTSGSDPTRHHPRGSSKPGPNKNNTNRQNPTKHS